MADFENLEKEACLFAEDLLSDIMSLHPVFRVYLPEHSPTPAKSSHFTRAVSKSVMVICLELKNKLKVKFRNDFNSFSKGDAALKAYLEHLCCVVREITTCKLSQVLGLSAVLLELIAILYRGGYSFFLSNAPIYWLLMFKNIAFDGFYKVGGWEGLTVLSKELEIDYDNRENKIYREYWDSDSMPWARPDQGSKKSSNSTEALSGIETGFASSSVITVKAELDTVSKDKIGTVVEGSTPSKDPVIPKTLEQTEQFSEEMTPKDEKAKDSKEQGREKDFSESLETLPGKKGTENVAPKPGKASKKDIVPKRESNTSRIGSAEADEKCYMPHEVQKGSDSNPKIPKLLKTGKESDILSTTPKSSNPSKMDFAPVGSTATGPKDEKKQKVLTTPLTPKATQPLTPKATKVEKSSSLVGQGATGTVTSASARNVYEDASSDPVDLNKSRKEKDSAKKRGTNSGSKIKPAWRP